MEQNQSFPLIVIRTWKITDCLFYLVKLWLCKLPQSIWVSVPLCKTEKFYLKLIPLPPSYVAILRKLRIITYFRNIVFYLFLLYSSKIITPSILLKLAFDCPKEYGELCEIAAKKGHFSRALGSVYQNCDLLANATGLQSPISRSREQSCLASSQCLSWCQAFAYGICCKPKLNNAHRDGSESQKLKWNFSAVCEFCTGVAEFHLQTNICDGLFPPEYYNFKEEFSYLCSYLWFAFVWF